LTISAQILWELRQQGFPVSMCFCPFESAGHWLILTMDSSYRGKYAAQQLLQDLAAALFRSRAGAFVPKIIVLDDDIDAANLDEVVWAFATRCHPERGQLIFPDEGMLPLVAFLNPAERKRARGAKAIYNGLRPDDEPLSEKPRRSSFRFLWPQEVQEKVVKNWKAYGYK
jgi:4-hydroxy-3-polyprenylbenzoate decarboxylase